MEKGNKSSLLFQFSRSVMSDSATPWTAVRQGPLSITNSQSLLKLLSIESMMPSNHLILCHPLLLLPSTFPSISVFFSQSVLLPSGGQSIGASASASVLPMNIPLGLTGWISLQCKGLSRVSSNPTVQKHQFFSAFSLNLIWLIFIYFMNAILSF